MTALQEPAGVVAGEIPVAPAALKAYMSKATKRYEWRQLQRQRGLKFDIDLLPADEYIKIVQAAKDRGLTYDEMERISGVNKKTLHWIALERRTRVTRKNAVLIARHLKDPDIRDMAEGSLIPITAYHRQIVQSLCAQGWTCKHLVQILRNNNKGSGAVIHVLPRPKSKLVRASSLKQLFWLAEVIGDKTGPSTRSIAVMQNRGVFPLRHYDENGRLRVHTLSAQQRSILKRIRSDHASTDRSSDGPRPLS